MSICLKNMCPQAVKLSVLDASGKLVELHLNPYGVSEPMDERCLDVHAKQLVSQGMLKIRRV